MSRPGTQHYTRNDPCPACGGGAGFCYWLTDPAETVDGKPKFFCMRQGSEASAGGSTGSAIVVPGYKAAKKAGKSKGAICYRPLLSNGELPAKREKTPDEKARDEAKTAEYRARARQGAAALWREAERHPGGGVGHERVRAYVRHRGIDIDQLAVWGRWKDGDGGVTLERWPNSLAYHPGCPRELYGPDGEALYDPPKRGRNGKEYRRRQVAFTPAMVCAMYRYGEGDGGGGGVPEPFVCGVQRVFLDPREGEAGKLPSELGGGGEHGKMQKGDCAGGFIPLSPRRGRGSRTLILCEGAETGLAIVAATWRGGLEGPAVWSCCSTSGLLGLELHPAVFNPEKLDRVIIAGDYDEWKAKGKIGMRRRPGPSDARISANRIAAACPWLAVEVALPTCDVAPSLLGPPGSDAHEGDEDGAKILGGGKTVDWLDVLEGEGNKGLEAVERGVMRGGKVISAGDGAALSGGGAAAPVPSRAEGDRTRERSAAPEGGAGDAVSASDAGGAGGGGGGTPPASRTLGSGELPPRRTLSDNPAVVAMEYLWDQCRPPRGGGRRFTLARWRSNWYEWRGTQWEILPEEELDARLWAWCSGFDHVRALKNETRVAPFHVKRELVSAVRACMVAHVTVKAADVPVWLPPVLPEDDEGGGVVGVGVGQVLWGSTVDPRAPRPFARPELGDVLGFANGWVSLAEMLERRVCELRPHTTDYFGGTSASYALPAEAVTRVLGAEDDAAIEAVYREVCPTWSELVRTWAAGDGDWPGVLQLMIGDALRSDRSMEKIFLLVGPRRSGKTTVVDVVLAGLVGEAAYRAINYTTFENRFGFSPLIGARVAVMGDAEFGKHDDPGRIVEGLKLVSGQSKVMAEEKGVREIPTVRLGCRVWITSNTVPSQLRDSSSALAGRFVILPFRTSFMGRERSDLKRTRLPAELPGIAVWAIEGAVRLASMPEPAIDMTGRGREIHEEFVMSSAPLLKYLNDRCFWAESDPPARAETMVLVRDLHKDYQKWCDDEGIAALGLGRFGHELRAVIPELTMGQPEAWGRKRVYYGIGLREEEGEARGTVYEPLQPSGAAGMFPPPA